MGLLDPKPGDTFNYTTFTISLPNEQVAFLKAQAAQRGVTVSDVLSGLVQREMRSRGKSLIEYNTRDEPTEVGVYACRVPMDECPAFHEDKFLMWFCGAWVHVMSDQIYRGEVTGWIGPLQRKLK